MSPNQNIKTSQKHNSIEPMYYAQFSLLYSGFFSKTLLKAIFSIPHFLFQTRHTIEKLQHLVSADGRFRTLRDALHRTDPPCIPFLGQYSMISVNLALFH